MQGDHAGYHPKLLARLEDARRAEQTRLDDEEFPSRGRLASGKIAHLMRTPRNSLFKDNHKALIEV